MTLLGRLKCWIRGRHVWRRMKRSDKWPIEFAEFDARDLRICNCGATRAVQRRKLDAGKKGV